MDKYISKPMIWFFGGILAGAGVTTLLGRGDGSNFICLVIILLGAGVATIEKLTE